MVTWHSMTFNSTFEKFLDSFLDETYIINTLCSCFPDISAIYLNLMLFDCVLKTLHQGIAWSLIDRGKNINTNNDLCEKNNFGRRIEKGQVVEESGGSEPP